MASEESSKNSTSQNWVQFDEESTIKPIITDDSPAVLEAQPVEVTLENNKSSLEAPANNAIRQATQVLTEPLNGNLQHPLQTPPNSLGVSTLNPDANTNSPSVSTLSVSQLQNVPLSDSGMTQPPRYTQTSGIRQGFANGDVIVSILPQNASLPWITPARFRPELVPEELMAQGLTLTVEDYVHIMTQLMNDHRFTFYNICYKRILMVWISLAFLILLGIMFAGFQHLAMFAAGIAWLIVNAAAIFVCMWMKLRLNKNLEHCLSQINMQLMRHKILLGVDDRGKLSCHKINLCFIYFDPQECICKLQQLIEQDARLEGNARDGPPLSQRMDIEDPDIIITGATNTRISQQQKGALILYCRYSQRWAKEYLRKRLDWAYDASARLCGLSPPVAPRHLLTARCPCQFIEDHMNTKLKQQERRKPCCSFLCEVCQDFEL